MPRNPRENTKENTRSLKPFIIWLVLFYLAWIAVVIVGEYATLALNHWPTALAMAAGSYIAGSTPMGGGTVGFPVLVLLMDQPAALGRDFSFAVQAIGMTSASIYIFCTRQALEWPMLRSALTGALIGTPLGIIALTPLVSDLAIKLVFATMWCSFGLLHLHLMGQIVSREGMTPPHDGFDRTTGFTVGLIGSMTVASITGVGVDMLLYTVLVLVCRADIKIAIPTSVVLMAFTSIVAITTKALLGDISPGTFGHWIAAAPVVAIGAPLGALVVSLVGRRPTLVLVSLLCLGQFGWTLWRERDSLDPGLVGVTFLGLALFLALFHGMRLFGRYRASHP